MVALPALSVQLYSVRNQLADDLPGTLARLAEIGLSNVEPFDLLGDPDALRAAVDANGLSAPSAHARVAEPGIDLGPCVDGKQLDKNLSYVDIGNKEGAKLVTGGERLKRDTDGFYMAPALFTETTNSMRLNKEEVFGPVAAVIRVKDYEEALAVANDTQYGLSSGIATTSLKLASHFKRNSTSGLVMVNQPTAGLDYHVPFGGRKKSSYGPREQGAYAKEFYTIVKTSYVAP